MLVILIGIQFIILPVEYKFLVDGQQNLLITLIGLGFVLCLLRFRKNDDTANQGLVLPKSLATLSFAIFCILIPLSSIWASHISLVWPPYIVWSVCFIVFLIGFSLDKSIVKGSGIPVAILLIISFNVVQLYLSYYILLEESDWQLTLQDVERNMYYFGSSTNLMGSIILLYIPLLLELRLNKWIKILAYIDIILIASLLPIFNARAITLALGILAVFYLWISFREKFLFKYIGLATSIAIASTLYFQLFIAEKNYFIQSYDFSRTIFEKTHDDRISIWTNSLKLFTEKPILGQGSGNWKTGIQKYGTHDFFDGQQYFQAHNLAIETLVELGLIGFLLLGGFYLYLLVSCIRLNKWNVFILLICLFFLCSFYGIYVHFFNYLSLYLVLAFAVSGVTLRSLSKPAKIEVPISICLIILGSGIYLNHTIGSFNKYLAHFQKAPHDKLSVLINQWDDYYNPYVNSYVNKTATLNYKSRQLWKLKKRKEAIKFNEEALRQYPYDLKVMTNLCNQYVSTRKYKKGSECFQNVLQLYDKSIDASFGLCRIGYHTNDEVIFNKGLELYQTILIPSFELYYRDEYLLGDGKGIIKFWVKRCGEIDEFQRLIDEMQTKSLKSSKSSDSR